VAVTTPPGEEPSTVKSTPDTVVRHMVPCIWGCGYLAVSEAELETHELECEHEHENRSVLMAHVGGAR
jgi:hypothetical protein